jgi:NAD(P)-dependent dehydrogenase (short-subunit alcohol dehydrogenase family)
MAGTVTKKPVRNRTFSQLRSHPGITRQMRPHGESQVKELTGKVALVTGGAVRVGRTIALALAAAGADVAIGYRRSAAEARDAVGELSACGVRAVAIAADIGKPPEARRLVRETVARLGRLDVLVNNAAIFAHTPFAETTPAQFDRIIAVNVRGAFFCAQAAARAMGRRGGRIINLADVGAVRAWPGYIPYGISKAGIVMLTKGLAAALAPAIQVNAVGPGVVLLPKGFRSERAQRLADRVPMKRHGEPADVAAAVQFFATCPEYITGQVLFVDGGATAI